MKRFGSADLSDKCVIKELTALRPATYCSQTDGFLHLSQAFGFITQRMYNSFCAIFAQSSSRLLPDWLGSPADQSIRGAAGRVVPRTS